MIILLHLIDFHFQAIQAILTENGICTNGKIRIGNETKILNLSAEDYIRKLTNDNRLIAEMMCHSMLNETEKNKIN